MCAPALTPMNAHVLTHEDLARLCLEVELSKLQKSWSGGTVQDRSESRHAWRDQAPRSARLTGTDHTCGSPPAFVWPGTLLSPSCKSSQKPWDAKELSLGHNQTGRRLSLEPEGLRSLVLFSSLTTDHKIQLVYKKRRLPIIHLQARGHGSHDLWHQNNHLLLVKMLLVWIFLSILW